MWSGLRVIWNPNRSQDPYDVLRSVRHPGEPSVTLFRSTRLPKASWFRFRVPDVAPGTYGIAQYDGGEGGSHYNHAYFTVLPAARRSTAAATRVTKARRDGDSARWAWVTGAAALVALLGVTAVHVRRSQPRPPGPPAA